jgi:hypothetical protein
MCGRYRLTAKERWLSEYFNLDPEDVDWVARWNVAPTQEVAVIRQDRNEPKRKFSLMRWGLIPYWAKDISIAARTINAVSETAVEKPVFRESMKKRRCLIPADGKCPKSTDVHYGGLLVVLAQGLTSAASPQSSSSRSCGIPGKIRRATSLNPARY